MSAMRASPLAILAMFLAVLLASPAALAASPELLSDRVVAVGELIGLTPGEVRTRISAAPADWPWRPALEMAEPGGGTVSFIQLYPLLQDPALREHLARFIAGQRVGPPPAHIACETLSDTAGGAPKGAGPLWLMFRDGRLAQVLETGPPTARDPEIQGSVKDRPKSFGEMARLPIASPYPVDLGDLPLADGLGFLTRWRQVPAAASTRIRVRCGRQAEPGPLRRTPTRLSDYNPQGLVGLPFVPAMPFINAHRRKAAEHGAAAMAALRLGEPAPGGADEFAKTHAGVRVLPGREPGYAVLAINVGALAGNQLENTDQVALAGLRDGRVAWIASDAGWLTLTLCLDQHGVRSAVRPGCKGVPARYTP
jgi:hypothetical protein